MREGWNNQTMNRPVPHAITAFCSITARKCPTGKHSLPHLVAEISQLFCRPNPSQAPLLAPSSAATPAATNGSPGRPDRPSRPIPRLSADFTDTLLPSFLHARAGARMARCLARRFWSAAAAASAPVRRQRSAPPDVHGKRTARASQSVVHRVHQARTGRVGAAYGVIAWFHTASC